MGSQNGFDNHSHMGSTMLHTRARSSAGKEFAAPKPLGHRPLAPIASKAAQTAAADSAMVREKNLSGKMGGGGGGRDLLRNSASLWLVAWIGLVVKVPPLWLGDFEVRSVITKTSPCQPGRTIALRCLGQYSAGFV